MATIFTLAEQLQKKETIRNIKRKHIVSANEDGWNVIENYQTSFTCAHLSKIDTLTSLIFTFRQKKVDFFLHFYPVDFIMQIVNRRLQEKPDAFLYTNTRRMNIIPSKIYKFLAIALRILGDQ